MTQDVHQLWHGIHDRLRAFIIKRVDNQAEAEDILQDVFLRMHRRLDSLKDPERLVMSWLFQITRNAIVDHYRAPERREVPTGLADDLEAQHTAPLLFGDESADAGQLRTELAGCLRSLIDRLPDQYREAVTLVEFEGLTQIAASKRLGLSVSGMKSRVQRGRQQLKRMLEDCCAIELDGRGGISDYMVRDARCNPCDAAKPRES